MDIPIIQGVKLKFGDEALIKLQKKYQGESEEREKLEKDRAEGVLKKFRVRLDFSGSVVIDVEATDKEKAEEIALEEADASDCSDIEFEVWQVTEIERGKR